ncbi:MAG: enoyl-CoA hydratase/isomerase family protein [Bacteroidetes bacterium]|nr:enoyl-CoA hydratase/isomerase family protein [Bacteroidota bacterium]
MPGYIDVQQFDDICTITIDRPDKRNALNGDVVTELQDAFLAAELDDGVRVIVLTGSGAVFCAGADLAWLRRISENSVLENTEDSRQLMQLMRTIHDCDKPTIARVNGHAIAGGCGLALACDIVIAVEDAKFGFTEVRIGFVPAIVMKLLVERCGMGIARELLIRGHLIDAGTALDYHMINHIVSAERFDETVTLIAQDISEHTSPQAVGMTKRLLREIASLDMTEAMDHAAWQNAISRATADFRLGTQSFLDRKKIQW